MSNRPTTVRIDSALQAQVDAQLLEHGAFSALQLLIDSGRLIYGDYENWRRRAIDVLDDVLMGSVDNIRTELDACAGYARSIGLVEQPQEFSAWHTDAPSANDKPLRISANTHLQRLIASRYIPARDVPQLDLFFHNPVVALGNGIVRALCARNGAEAQRLLNELYAQEPNHADLPGFDLLTQALEHAHSPLEAAQHERDFLLRATPVAKRLLGSQSRDFLAPLWKQLAQRLADAPFLPHDPTLHRSFALSLAQDWPGVAAAVQSEPDWWRQAPLCLLLAQSGFYRQRRIEALTGWFNLCWHSPDIAADTLDHRRAPDSSITAAWQAFLECEEDDDAQEANALTAEDFPAWLLLHEPGLAQHFDADSTPQATPGHDRFRCVQRLIQARRARQSETEMALRRELQAQQPRLLRYLIRQVG